MISCIVRRAVGVSVVSVGSGCWAPDAEAARPWPDSSERIVVFADQLDSGMSADQLAFAATRLAGTQKMTRSDIRAIRAYNANFLCLHYQLALGCGPHDFIIGDDWTSDWATVNAHEDWFLHNASDQRVYQTAWGWDVMDITYTGAAPNTDFPEYWITTVLDRIAVNEDDGVFADSFTVDGYGSGQCSPSHAWLEDIALCQDYWIPALHAYADAVKSRFEADGRGFLFLPNLGALVTGWDTTDYQRLGHGGMIEGFCFWEGGSYFDVEDWELQLGRMADLVYSNKVLLCQTYIGSAGNYQDRMFATASHLLIKGAHTYFFMLAGEGLEYYPEYEVSLGRALADLPADFTSLWNAAWGVYRRDYTNGIVLVNPGTEPADISSLGGSYWRVSASGGGAIEASAEYSGSLSYTAVTSLTLPANSGAILLRSTNAPLSPPVAVSASDGTYTDRIRVSWTAAAGATGYEVWRGTNSNSGSATKISSPDPTGTSYDDSRAASAVTYYYWVKTVNTSGVSSFSASASGFLGVLGPLITANGLMGEVRLNNGEPVTIAVQMMNMDAYLGFDVDWWVMAAVESGEWYYLDSDRQWISFNGDLAFCRPVYQGGIFHFGSTPVLDSYVLAPGTYNFWFAVDSPMDDILNLNGPILYNKVTVILP